MTQEMLQKIIDDFNKQYRIKRMLFMILFFIAFLVLVWCTLHFMSYLFTHVWAILVFLLIYVPSTFFLYIIRIRMFSRIAYQAIHGFFEKGDMESAYAISTQLLIHAKRYTKAFVVSNHMSILMYMGRYEEIQTLIEQYANYICSPSTKYFVKGNILTLATRMSVDTQYALSLFQKRKRIKYIQNKNTRKQETMLNAREAYLQQQYETVLEYLDNYQAEDTISKLNKTYLQVLCYDKLHREKEKQQAMEIVLTYSDAFVYVREVRAMKEQRATQEFYVDGKLVVYLQDCMMRQQKRSKRRKRIFILIESILILLFVLLSFVSSRVRIEYTTIPEVISAKKDYIGEEAFLQFDEENFHVALVSARGKVDDKEQENLFVSIAQSIRAYYVSVVKTENNRVRYVSMDGGYFSFDTFAIETYPIKDSAYTYVLIKGDIASLRYDNKKITDFKSENITGIMKDDVSVLNAFIIKDKNFSKEKINVTFHEKGVENNG